MTVLLRASGSGGDEDGLGAGGMGRGECCVEGVVVTAVNGAGLPSLDLEAGADPAGPTELGGGVVHDDGGEVVEPVSAGDGDGLVVAALVEFSVTDEDDDPGFGAV